MQSTDLIQLDAGDYIQVYVVNAAGANKELESTEANTYLNIYKLS